MKKNKLVALVLGLCFAVSLLSGCNNATDESAEVSRIGGGQTKINVDNGGSKKPAVGDYKFSYKYTSFLMKLPWHLAMIISPSVV